MKGRFFECSCKHHGLWIEYIGDSDIEFALFERPYSDRSWRNRIKLAWQCLKGKPYGDQLIFQQQHIADIVDHLIEIQNIK